VAELRTELSLSVPALTPFEAVFEKFTNAVFRDVVLTEESTNAVTREILQLRHLCQVSAIVKAGGEARKQVGLLAQKFYLAVVKERTKESLPFLGDDTQFPLPFQFVHPSPIDFAQRGDGLGLLAKAI
jgi:hypothetical protein